MTIRTSSLTTLAVLSLAPSLFAQASWTALGTGTAADMSDDGQFVVGSIGTHGFLWSASGVQVDLGVGTPTAVSSDGTIVSGRTTNLAGESVAARWQQGTGWVELPGAGGAAGSSISVSYGMSADGSKCAGFGWNAAGLASALSWDAMGNVTFIPQSGPLNSQASSMSADGTLIGGWDDSAGFTARAVVWDALHSQTFVAVTPGNLMGFGKVFGFSNNNSYVVGVTDDEGFIWNSTAGVTKTGSLPGGGPFTYGEARDVSDDGQKVVGLSRVTSLYDFRATIWTPGAGLQELKSYLEANGGSAVPELILASAISSDGFRILAYGPQGWGIGTLGFSVPSYCSCDATAPCGNSAALGEGCQNSTGKGAVVAAAGGISVGADNLTLECEQLPPGKPSLLFAGLNQINGGAGSLFGDGLLCVGGGIQRLGVVVSSQTGSAAFGPGLVATGAWNSGDVRNFQVWYRDQAGPCAAGFNTSNALQVTFTP